MSGTTLLVCGGRDALDDVMVFFWLDFVAAKFAQEGRVMGEVAAQWSVSWC